jgi:hypothetical protein
MIGKLSKSNTTVCPAVNAGLVTTVPHVSQILALHLGFAAVATFDPLVLSTNGKASVNLSQQRGQTN